MRRCARRAVRRQHFTRGAGDPTRAADCSSGHRNHPRPRLRHARRRDCAPPALGADPAHRPHRPARGAPDGRLTAACDARLRDLSIEIVEVGLHLADLASLRDRHDERISEVRARLDELDRAERLTADTYVLTGRELTEPRRPPLPTASTALRARTAEIDARALAGRWDQLDAELAGVEQEITRAGRRAAQLRAAAAGLIVRRDELRSLLQACRSRAAANGLAGNEQLTALHDLARTLLFTTPCDLRAGTRAVHAYRQYLTQLVP
ncbi:hypothetical protein [Dactylosporangium cerinum]